MQTTNWKFVKYNAPLYVQRKESVTACVTTRPENGVPFLRTIKAFFWENLNLRILDKFIKYGHWVNCLLSSSINAHPCSTAKIVPVYKNVYQEHLRICLFFSHSRPLPFGLPASPFVNCLVLAAKYPFSHLSLFYCPRIKWVKAGLKRCVAFCPAFHLYNTE